MRNETSPLGHIPPPAIFGAAIGLSQVAKVCRSLPLAPSAFTPVRRLLGGALVIGGLVTGLWVVRTMRQAGESPDPREASQQLVTDGPFQYSRNPLYITMTAVYLGITMLRNNLWGALLLPGILAAVRIGAIEREEEYLSERFGTPYRNYMERVPRWL